MRVPGPDAAPGAPHSQAGAGLFRTGGGTVQAWTTGLPRVGAEPSIHAAMGGTLSVHTSHREQAPGVLGFLCVGAAAWGLHLG